MGHVTTSEFFQLEDKTLTDDRSSQPWFRPRQGGNHYSVHLNWNSLMILLPPSMFAGNIKLERVVPKMRRW